MDIARILDVSLCQLLGVESDEEESVPELESKAHKTNDVHYLSEIAKVLGGIESVTLKDKIVEIVKMMAV